MDLLYNRDGCLVVYKPAGLPTQAPPGIESVETRLRTYFRSPADGSVEDYLGMVHRLDRPVSGALLVARRKKIARKLSKQFERRTVRKIYWAVVEGEVAASQESWSDYVRKVPNVARAEIAAPDVPGSQLARSRIQVLKRFPSSTLLEIELETGRYHQIRVQASSRGHAILGDTLYGSSVSIVPPPADPRAVPIALHARELAFDDPTTKERIIVVAKTPDYWRAWNV